MATSAVSPVPRAPWRLWRSPYLWLATVHLLGDAVVVLVVGLLVLVTLVVAVLALPLAYFGIRLTVSATRVVYHAGSWERSRARITRNQVIPPVFPPARSASAVQDCWIALTDRVLWRQFGYFVLLFGMACAGIPAIVLAWSVPPVLIALPFYYSGWAAERSQLGPFEIDSLTKAGVVGVLALLFLLFVSPLLIRGLSAVDGLLVRNLLGASATGALAKRVDQLVESRQQVVNSVEAERRRMERDLHDGAQQRLVSLAMTLGRARSRLGKSNPGVLELIEQAHAEAMQAITELRDLTRGLHPPVLTDRGLDAAISAVAARAPFPVRVDIRVPVRPSLTIESIVYFVVTESLTNIAKHAQAARAAIRIIRVGDRLRLVVTDDGRGGADPDRGTGLQGLIDRVSGVDGDFSVVSPIGGPTVVTVEVPCG
ncbi:signal transduction histidine kinase [Kribbella voronezhensis]|uniref:histidine kinase n=1 Tax=Kribbella voronezhensis TaxID=2512212 RepID=A0A4R7TF84_9ACTN|nr:sensor domain-containing protein [Kribbella voronezhensis]TDU90844.1 signal transduction histidine kinase [Kribbella voronezhensis]